MTGHNWWTIGRNLWEPAARSPQERGTSSPLTAWGGRRAGQGATASQQGGGSGLAKTTLRGTAPGTELEAELAAAEGRLGVSDQMAP